MERLRVECLCCGTTRVRGERHGDECPRCGYLGWAASCDLNEAARRALRERPPERRRLRALA
jgi:hypothetical protein